MNTRPDYERDQSHPPWLRETLNSPKSIWNAWVMMEARENQRASLAALSRTQLDPSQHEVDDDEEFYSVRVGDYEETARFKSRWPRTEPYDRNRVIVSGDPSRYVNASWIRENEGGRWWVAAQPPTTHTMHAFLSLFFPCDENPESPRIRTVVQLSKPTEGPVDPYFPPNLSQEWTIAPERGSNTSNTLEPIYVQTKKQKRVTRGNFTKTTFTVTRRPNGPGSSEESYSVTHLLYETWPDHSVPNTTDGHALISLIHALDPLNSHPPTRPSNTPASSPASLKSSCIDPPILVHCGKGGRTGTFIAINSVLRAYGCIPSPYDETAAPPPIPQGPQGPLPSEYTGDDIMREVDALRDQRLALVENESQLRFIYQMLWEAISERDWEQGRGQFTRDPGQYPRDYTEMFPTKRKPKRSMDGLWSSISAIRGGRPSS